MSTKTAKKEAMKLFTLRLPQSVLDRLEKRALQASKKSGVVIRPVAIARLLLEEHA